MSFLPQPPPQTYWAATQSSSEAMLIKERILADWRENGFPGTKDQNSRPKKQSKKKRRYKECSACQWEARLADSDNMSTTSTITPDYLTHDHPRSNSYSSIGSASSSSSADEQQQQSKNHRSLGKRIADKLTPGASTADTERPRSSASTRGDGGDREQRAADGESGEANDGAGDGQKRPGVRSFLRERLKHTEFTPYFAGLGPASC